MIGNRQREILAVLQRHPAGLVGGVLLAEVCPPGASAAEVKRARTALRRLEAQNVVEVAGPCHPGVGLHGHLVTLRGPV